MKFFNFLGRNETALLTTNVVFKPSETPVTARVTTLDISAGYTITKNSVEELETYLKGATFIKTDNNKIIPINRIHEIVIET